MKIRERGCKVGCAGTGRQKISEKREDENFNNHKKLWFVNLGGYKSDRLLEAHEFGLVIANTSSEAKEKAKQKLLYGVEKKQLKSKKTIIIISHNKKNLEMCDKIFELQNKNLKQIN